MQDIGGLGHLGVQFAARFGYQVVAISRGKENERLARKLGAHQFIDSALANPAADLQKLGGAQVILATAPSGKAMSDLFPGLAPRGKLLVLGAGPDPLAVPSVSLIAGSKTIQGWASGTPAESEETLCVSLNWQVSAPGSKNSTRSRK